MKTLTAGALSAFILLTGSAVAQQTVPLKEGHLDYVDTNDDNVVQPSEMQVFAGQAFGTLDANKDGALVSAETAAILTPAQFSAVDDNGDGRISQAELTKQMSEDFAAADRDKNGQLN